MARSRTCKSDVSASSLRARARKGNAQCALGVLMASLLFEVALRPIVVDSSRLGVRTIRNYFEGLSCAHFEADGLGEVGSRVTGNLRLSGAPEGMIIGDSHVVAYSVRDEETMGSVVERLSRTAGRPLNVRQYGWHGANSPTFLAAAESLLRARNPSWVAVVLNSYNIGVNALVIRGGWRMEVAPGQEAQVDFGTGAPIVGAEGKRRRTHVFRIVLSHSRKGYSEVVWRQTSESFLRSLENAFRHYGGVPVTVVIDNLKAGVVQADWFDPEINPKLEEFARFYGTVILPTKPAMP